MFGSHQPRVPQPFRPDPYYSSAIGRAKGTSSLPLPAPLFGLAGGIKVLKDMPELAELSLFLRYARPPPMTVGQQAAVIGSGKSAT
jgi:hypothetical protein